MNKNFWLLFILLISFVPTGCEELEEDADTPNDVEIFLLEINPELYRATAKMKNELREMRKLQAVAHVERMELDNDRR